MAKTRQQKEEIVKNVSEQLKGATSAVISSFTAVSVNDDQSLRAKARASNVHYHVISKTLLKRTLEVAGFDTVDTLDVQGSIGIAVADDEVTAARIIHEFSKERENVSIFAGFLEQKFIDSTAVKALASLPGKDELIAKTVWSIKSPLSGFANVLIGPARNLVCALNAIAQSKG